MLYNSCQGGTLSLRKGVHGADNSNSRSLQSSAWCEGKPMDWMLDRGSKQLLKDDRRLTETGNIMFEQCRQKLFEQLFEQRLIESKPTGTVTDPVWYRF